MVYFSSLSINLIKGHFLKFSCYVLFFIFAIFNNSFCFATDKASLAFDYMGSKDWEKAKEVAMDSNDEALMKLVFSQKFLDTKCQTNDFESVIRFIKGNPHWPQKQKLLEAAEQYLSKDTNQKFILNWFNKNKPLTGKGYKYYALAASNLETDLEKLSFIIKDGWIYGDFSLEEEKNFYENYKKFLTQEDHIKRIEEHLWISDIEEAKRSFYLVSKEHQKSFEVAILAINGDAGAEEAFKNLPTNSYIPVVLYNYLNFKKKTPPDDYMVSLFKKVPVVSAHPEEWAKLQLYYARELFDTQDFVNSYKIISRHFAVSEENIREAEWLCGWLALRHLKKPDLALTHFNKFAKVSHRPISLAKSKYWLARCYEAKGDHEKARNYYRFASKYTHTFYGQLASTELKENKITLPASPKIDSSHRAAIENNDIIRATKFLVDFGKPHLAETYAKAALELIKTPGEVALLADMIKEQGNLYYTVGFAKLASQKHVMIKGLAYPAPYKFKKIPIEAPLAYAIIRQESVFNHSAVSNKNAMGLMQLIKGTACSTAKLTNDKCNIASLTRDPEYNIRLGTTYLSQLIKERRGSYILAIASYNTNGRNVDKWIKRFGDPREMKSIREIIDWLELIPFHETRNYVQRVLEGLQVYRYILKGETRLKLKQDLLRGI